MWLDLDEIPPYKAFHITVSTISHGKPNNNLGFETVFLHGD